MTAAQGLPSSLVLPALRDDLSIIRSEGGAGDWIILDPLKNAHFRISRIVFEVLSTWTRGTFIDLQNACLERHGRVVQRDEVERIVDFLFANELTTEPKEGAWRSFAGLAEKRKKSLLSKSLHSYLFVRIPLARPQRLLDGFWPLIRPLYTKGFAFFLCVLSVLSIWLVIRQWDVFASSFSSFLTLQGAALYGGGLVFVKIIHELGHAFMAKKYDVHVPTIGVALIVLFPILYTDTTSAWRLSRRKRLMIDAAGIYAELGLAVIATALWVFLPEGNLRALAFVVATISWVMSLAVNLNPLMRFDGYYLLSDGLGIENLQGRGFALARWRLREFLFGLGEDAPEAMTPKLRFGVIAHAYATWIYRFFLFLGIALIVYHMFFKLAGIALFIVEIVWFIGLPIWRELQEWVKRLPAMRLNFQTLRSFGLLIAGGVLLFFPLDRSVHAPAVYSTENAVSLYPLGSGRVAFFDVEEGDQVRRGDVILRVEDDQLETTMSRVREQINVAQLRLRRSSADAKDLSFRTVLFSELESRKEEAEQLQQRINELTLYAPMDGIISNIKQDLAIGQYIGETTRIGIIKSGEAGEVTAFLPSSQIDRIELRAAARFIAEENYIAQSHHRVEHVEPPAEGAVIMRMQYDVNGGDVVTKRDPDTGDPIASVPHYRVRLSAANGLDVPAYEVRGTVHIDAVPESFGAKIARQVIGVLIRESGF